MWWAKVVTTPPNLDLVGAGPVGSHHGSYRCARYGGGQIWGGTWGSARAASMVMATATSPRFSFCQKIDMLNGPNALILLRGHAKRRYCRSSRRWRRRRRHHGACAPPARATTMARALSRPTDDYQAATRPPPSAWRRFHHIWPPVTIHYGLC